MRSWKVISLMLLIWLISTHASATPPDVLSQREMLIGANAKFYWVLMTEHDNLGSHTQRIERVVLLKYPLVGTNPAERTVLRETRYTFDEKLEKEVVSSDKDSSDIRIASLLVKQGVELAVPMRESNWPSFTVIKGAVHVSGGKGTVPLLTREQTVKAVGEFDKDQLRVLGLYSAGNRYFLVVELVYDEMNYRQKIVPILPDAFEKTCEKAECR